MSEMEQPRDRTAKRGPKPHPVRDMWDAVWNMKLSTVLVMIGVSMGLGLCAYQIATDQVVEVMAVFWALTALAILVFSVHWAIGRPRPDRRQRAAH